MTKLLTVFLVAFIFLTTGLTGGEKIITANSEHDGDINIKKGNLKIESRADLTGNIFIEHGIMFFHQSPPDRS